MSEEIKIEKGVPMPLHSGHGMTAAMRAMEGGDSFLIDASQHRKIHPTARNAGIKITTRKEGDKIRVWKKPS